MEPPCPSVNSHSSLPGLACDKNEGTVLENLPDETVQVKVERLVRQTQLRGNVILRFEQPKSKFNKG